jgi:hypothetical protein
MNIRKGKEIHAQARNRCTVEKGRGLGRESERGRETGRERERIQHK